MGKEIVYCHVCGDRILQKDFASGKAIVADQFSYCRKCGSSIRATRSLGATRASEAGGRQTRRIARLKEPRHRMSRATLITLIAIGAFVVFALIIIAVSRSG